MPESYGKLDGLREIIAPVMPEQALSMPWWLIILILIVLLLLLLAYVRYRNRPIAQARRQYRRLRRQRTPLDGASYGEAIISILRIYQGSHHLRRAATFTVDTQQWAALLDDCNRLRFSAADKRVEDIERVMNNTKEILWPPA